MLCCFALFVCLPLLASFFLPSLISQKHVYIVVFLKYAVYARDTRIYTCSISILYHRSVFSENVVYGGVWRSVFSITSQYSLPQVSILYHRSVFSTTVQYSQSMQSMEIASGQYSLSQTESLMSLY